MCTVLRAGPTKKWTPSWFLAKAYSPENNSKDFKTTQKSKDKVHDLLSQENWQTKPAQQGHKLQILVLKKPQRQVGEPQAEGVHHPPCSPSDFTS